MLDELAPGPLRLDPALRFNPALRLVPCIEDFRALPGPISVRAAPDHRVRIHKGAPVRGVCGRQAFTSTRGDIDLLPAGMGEEWLGEEPTDSLLLTLPLALFARAAAELGQDERSAFDARCLLRDPRIEHIVWALDAERGAGSPGGMLYAESLGLALAAHLLAAYTSRPASVRVRSIRALSSSERTRITRYIEDHLDRSLTLSTLAAQLGMSSSHFKAVFRRSLGVPVHEYIIQRRVDRAKRLLLRADRPAAEVALAAGFSHQSHMARCMRRILGVTPSVLLEARKGRGSRPRTA
jgi:AraC family transcriptional regulator